MLQRRLRRSALCVALLLCAPVMATADGSRTAFGGSAAPVAQRGDRSPVVATTQRLLQNAGINVPGGVDGIYGPGTTSAVAEYQRRRGLAATGVLDVGTATLLGVLPATPLLTRGASGSPVVLMQQRLLAAGVAVPGGADGRFGPMTQAALQRFQSSRGIPPTGSLDAATRAALASAAAPSPPAPPVIPAPPSGPPGLPLAARPLPAGCTFSDTFGAPRSGGRTHEGVDLMAPKGTPIFAVQRGTITKLWFDAPGSLSGNGIKLTAADGTYFFYAHLDRFADGVSVGSVVGPGAVIGYVGSTGNAGTPHLHLEVHPGGGAAVNPYPIVLAAGTCR